jgi:hypothetical protein
MNKLEKILQRLNERTESGEQVWEEASEPVELIEMDVFRTTVGDHVIEFGSLLDEDFMIRITGKDGRPFCIADDLDRNLVDGLYTRITNKVRNAEGAIKEILEALGLEDDDA